MSSRRGSNCVLRSARSDLQAYAVPEEIIARDEVIALLFNVSDIAVSLAKIERLLGGDDGEEEADEG